MRTSVSTRRRDPCRSARLRILAERQWVCQATVATDIARHAGTTPSAVRLRLEALGLRDQPHRGDAARGAVEWTIPTVVRWLDRVGLGAWVPDAWRAWMTDEHVELVVAGISDIASG